MRAFTNRGGKGTVAWGVRRAWAMVEPITRKRLRSIAAFGTLIACLDAAALLLVYGLITLFSSNDAKPSGVVGRLIGWLTSGISDRYDQALLLLAMTAVLFVVRSLLSVFNSWLMLGEVNKIQADLLRRILVGKALSPQLLRIERNSADALRTLAFSIDQVAFGVVGASVAIVANLAITVAVGVGLFLSSPVVALTVLVYFSAIAVAWTRGVSGALRRRGESVQALEEERYRLIMQTLSAAKELQLRGRVGVYAESASAATRGINAATRGVGVLNNSVRNMLETALVLGTVLVVVIAGAANGHAAALPTVGVLLAAAFRLLPALSLIMSLSNSVQYNLPAITLVGNDLETYDAVEDRARSEVSTLEPLTVSELCVRDVSFRYPSRERKALRGIDLTVRRGETVAIIGPTGSGKSTLLDIVLGILDPDGGEVVLDGEPLAALRHRWQRSIGYVPQDVYLVDDTLRANIALGWRGADIDEIGVAESLRSADLEEVVAHLPDGLDTMVGERGVRFSGGQRQRVGIARALYTRPSVLVLDEATSNLDRGTEARIVETLARLHGGITTIMVTHRVESVRNCDRLIYLEEGSVRATGSFDELWAELPGILSAEETDDLAVASEPADAH